jgi:hypothetical protein
MQRLGYYIIILTIFASCGSLKKSSTSNKGLELSTKSVSKSNESLLPQNEWVIGRLTASYESEDMSQNINVKFRYHRDEAIWMSGSFLGVQVGKVFVEDNRIQFYEKIGKQYYDGSFQSINELMDLALDYQDLQRLLLGMPIRPLKSLELDRLDSEEAYVYRTINSIKGYRFSFFIDPKDFYLKQVTIETFDTAVPVARLIYTGRIQVGDYYWPEIITFKQLKKDNPVEVQLQYKRLEERKKLSFPYRAPARYDEIKLNK